MLSAAFDIEVPTTAIGVVYATGFFDPSDRHWMRATLIGVVVAFLLVVPGGALLALWVPESGQVVAGFGFGFFFGALAYAKVTQRRA
ncbi:hypothetical protein SAMN05443668_11042 [Cryptosporangium aurantiacum]|uniref:Uncharacterized protein n=1 Tax=Cryptosporangium aurantiacum TaxID=134849 RepID=A0A1M7RDE5_9ACTN|nr:hypothetical protein SAMN05443668_11042 [Cryptosporangium aurantiacum]